MRLCFVVCIRVALRYVCGGMTSSSNQTLLVKVPMQNCICSSILTHATCNGHELRQAKVCLWLAKQVRCMVHANHAEALSREMLFMNSEETSCAASASGDDDLTAHILAPSPSEQP